MKNQLLYSKEKNIAAITINRQDQRNTITPALIGLFMEYLDTAEADEDVRAVLITGAGDRVFCAGADLGNVMEGDGDAVLAVDNYANLLKRLAGFPKPTVARVNGSCVAGGTGFMLACDIVIAADSAKFGTPEINVGLFPMMIGALIFRNVPRKKAMEMVLMGDKLSAQDALEMGLITRAVPPGELDSEVNKVLEKLSSKSPIGIKIGKGAFSAIDTMSLEDSLDYLSKKFLEVAATEDAREGITAYLEKREPKFKGR